MKNKAKHISVILIVSVIAMISCRKDFLDEKPATNLNVPTSITDLQLLLNNSQVLNTVSPGLNEIASDDFQIGYAEWLNIPVPYYKNSYTWEKDIFQGQGEILEWNKPYTGILLTNVILEQLEKISVNNSNSSDINNLKGSALFIRSYLLFDLVQTFAMPYDKSSSSTDLGIPIRLHSEINAPTKRASIQATYNQILSDVILAKSLLKENYTSGDFNRPTKAAAYGFLSRIFLNMRDYDKAGIYADSALSLHNTLINYNEVDVTSAIPFPLLKNVEIIYDSNVLLTNVINNLFRGAANFSIIPTLYNSYDNNDLRKTLYYKKTDTGIGLKIGYAGQRGIPNSITTAELYLTRAECYARNGMTTMAMADLNTLMKMRWNKSVSFPLFTASSSSIALNQILVERRKELVVRGLRWNDIRRLNKEGRNITLTRNLNGTIYTLQPNDPKYAFPIPPDVISRSGIQQNIR